MSLNAEPTEAADQEWMTDNELFAFADRLMARWLFLTDRRERRRNLAIIAGAAGASGMISSHRVADHAETIMRQIDAIWPQPPQQPPTPPAAEIRQATAQIRRPPTPTQDTCQDLLADLIHHGSITLSRGNSPGTAAIVATAEGAWTGYAQRRFGGFDIKSALTAARDALSQHQIEQQTSPLDEELDASRGHDGALT